MLVHICCSVDCDYFLARLREVCGGEELVGYFYDPNIHPYCEYLLRLADVRRACAKYGVRLIEGEYDFERWYAGAKTLAKEPEKGERCAFCFDFRFERTAKLAKEMGEEKITTTLLMSPKKSFSQLVSSMEKICARFGLNFVAPDFRKNGGTAAQMALARADKLYRQNFCGCFFAINSNLNGEPRRETFELAEPLGTQIQFMSPKWRLKTHEKLVKFESREIKFELIREKFLNYRLRFARVRISDNDSNLKVIRSYFLFYSHLPRKKSRFTLESAGEIIRAPKDEIILLSLEKFNALGGFKFESVCDLLKNPPALKAELKVRKKLAGAYSLSPIIVIEKGELKAGFKFEIECDSVVFADVRERVKKL